METDFYELLGVARTATDDELKKAYRKLARELHPDANPGDADAEERFKKVTLAYEVLRDPERRRQYDTYGINGVRGTGSTGGGGDPFGGGFSDMNLGDIFDAFFGGGASPFGGGQRRGSGGPPSGGDMEAKVTLDLEQAVFGAEVSVPLKLPIACETCAGSGSAPGTEPQTCGTCNGQGEVRRVRQSILGQVVTASPCSRCQGTGRQIVTPCTTCHGDGRVTAERTIEVAIPAGIDRGQSLRLTGRGAAGPRGGAAGDLYLHVDVRPHERFERHDFDLVCVLEASMTQAALGSKLVLKTLDGEENVVLDAGTQSGKVFRFRGKGVPHVDGRGRGDLLVQLHVSTPTKLDDEQHRLLLQLAELRGEDITEPEPGFFDKLKGAFK